MKFFEAVPDELFSPLASPNRALYADALDVLYTAYREKLKPARLRIDAAGLTVSDIRLVPLDRD